MKLFKVSLAVLLAASLSGCILVDDSEPDHHRRGDGPRRSYRAPDHHAPHQGQPPPPPPTRR